jgi:hypothetical protein
MVLTIGFAEDVTLARRPLDKRSITAWTGISISGETGDHLKFNSGEVVTILESSMF